ncbi:MAG: translation elongation factor 4 [Candidatus Omnitrophica bacterium]|nr:translation elongation factor 4 [Candidatus Omnitrophota bacterium]
MEKLNIRNFSIIAHIDHGKSTLADRILQFTHTIRERKFRDQILDSMDLEREHGVTIKSHPVRILYQDYILNLLDTPGHIDFSSEVAKGLTASEGALLLIDASQGVQAQTITNLRFAQKLGLSIIPVINKIDLSTSQIERTKLQFTNLLKVAEEEIILASAKEGIGIKEVLQAIIERIPPPEGEESPFRALIFDAHYNPYMGVDLYIRVKDGQIVQGTPIKFIERNLVGEVKEVGIFTPKLEKVDRLSSGEVGYLSVNIKDLRRISVGDTITTAENGSEVPLAPFEKRKTFVYSSFYPADDQDYEGLRESLLKLSLNDSSFTYEPEVSQSLGAGFRCGFSGLFHMEIIQERLEREYSLSLVRTTPYVTLRVKKKDGEIIKIKDPASLPPVSDIKEIQEPFLSLFIIAPSSNIGDLIQLCLNRRGTQKSLSYLSQDTILLTFEIPFSEILLDFYDRLKTVTHGFGSLDYSFVGYRKSDLVRLDILINGKLVDALSVIVPRENGRQRAIAILKKLKEVIPRQLFQIVIQVAINNRIIAREAITASKKFVTGKCYGGDITRKRKLWEKQKIGKQRMKSIGVVKIPQEAFMALLKT